MASNTRSTWKRRVRKAKESRNSTPSAAKLFAELGPPEGSTPAAKQK
jgi:hypothetical protein